MLRVVADPTLTRGYGEPTETAIRRSVPGMAHFVVSGTSHRCGDCIFFELKGRWKGRCAMHARLMRGRYGPPIATSQTACKHWLQRPEKRGR